MGAVILGHADPVVDAAVKHQIDRGSIYTRNSPLEIELAEDIEQTVAAAVGALQMIRRGLENDELDALLLCDLTEEPFCRLVR